MSDITSPRTNNGDIMYSPRTYSGSYEDPTSSSEPLYNYVGPKGDKGDKGDTGPTGPDISDFNGGNAYTVYSSADFDFESGGA